MKTVECELLLEQLMIMMYYSFFGRYAHWIVYIIAISNGKSRAITRVDQIKLFRLM